jgi:hypothetical protein
MRGKLFFGAATAALLMFAPTALAQDADQPGDASTQARLGSDAVDGALTVGDADWFRLSVEQGRRYSLAADGVADAEGNAVDTMLSVYDASGNQLAFNDDANGTLNAALTFAPPQSGEVFVEVRAFSEDATGAYRLTGSSAEVPPDDAGNDSSTRSRMAAGRSVTGNIEYEGDVDWYRLNVRTGQRYRVTLDGAADSESALADPLLRVVDAEGAELAMSDDNETGLNSALDFVPQQNGEVFIEARGYADAYTGQYTLAVAAERLPSDGVAAGRNTRGRVSVGNSVTGSIDFTSDADWHRIRLEEGQSYRFALAADGANPLSDPYLRVMNASGEEVAMDDDGGEGFNSYLEFTAPSAGNYYLAAAAFADGSTGNYRLSANAGDIPADASTDVGLAPDGDYREGALAPAGDRDWYRLNLAEGQGLRIGVASAPVDPLGDPYAILYGPDGAEILRDDDGGDGLNAWFEYQAATAGAYYLEVRGFSEDSAGRYAVTVTAGEIGGSAEGAEYLAPGYEGRSSLIGTPDDSDWYSVEMIEGRPYRFSLEGAEPDALADPMLTLYDAQGNQIAADDDGGTGVNAYLTFTSPTGGPYFAAVSSFNGGSAGRYMLRVTDTDVPGNLNTDEMLDGAGDDRLSNIDMPGDLDYYRVSLAAGVAYTIEVNGTGEHPLADAFVALIGMENQRIDSDDDSGSGLDARLRVSVPQDGEYYIQASGLGGSTGGYQVSIVRQ